MSVGSAYLNLPPCLTFANCSRNHFYCTRNQSPPLPAVTLPPTAKVLSFSNAPHRVMYSPGASFAHLPFASQIQYVSSVAQARITAVQWIDSAKRRYAATEDTRESLPFFCHLDVASGKTKASFLTLAFEQFCLVFDLRTIALNDLDFLFVHLSKDAYNVVIVDNSFILSRIICPPKTGIATAPLDVQMPMIYDMELGRELLDGQTGASFLDTAKAVYLKLSHPDAVLPVADLRQCKPLAERVRNLQKVFMRLVSELGNRKCRQWLRHSTLYARKMISEGTKPCESEVPICFLKGTHVMQSQRLTGKSEEVACTALTRYNEAKELALLLQLLPPNWAAKVQQEAHRHLIDVEVDVGRPPFAFFQTGPKLLLSEGRDDVVQDDHIRNLSTRLEDAGSGIGTDNRAGIHDTLHRISVIRARNSDKIIGATLRASRHIYGVSSVLYDVLFSEKHRGDSVLLVGPPGSGKTTMGRDIARLLSEHQRVIIVDSSDEIAGPGMMVHKCVGDARRISVPSGKGKLAGKLVEAMENHTPDVLIADELSNKEEVAGASTVKLRGVRLISSAHGSLRSLLSNAALRGLLGGVENVTVSDRAAGATENNGRNKLKAVRAAQPVFNVVVEMGIVAGDPSACRVVRNVSAAVDVILSGGNYECEVRRRSSDDQVMMIRVRA